MRGLKWNISRLFLAVMLLVIAAKPVVAMPSMEPLPVSLSQEESASWLGLFVEDRPEGVRVVGREMQVFGYGVLPEDRPLYLRQINDEIMYSMAQYYAFILNTPLDTPLQVTFVDDTGDEIGIFDVRTIIVPPAVVAYAEAVVAASSRQADAIRLFAEVEQMFNDELWQGGYMAYLQEAIAEAVGDLHLQEADSTAALASYVSVLDLTEDAQYYVFANTNAQQADLLINARIWAKISQVYAALGEEDRAWEAYAQAQTKLEEEGFYTASLGMALEADEKLQLSARNRVDLLVNTGHLFYKLRNFDEAFLRFEEAAALAREDHNQSGESTAYVGLALIGYVEGDLAFFNDQVRRALSFPLVDSTTVKQQIASEVALYELVPYLENFIDIISGEPIKATDIAAARIFRVLAADVDGDGEEEIIVAAGTVPRYGWGVGAVVVVDWQAGAMRYYLLGSVEVGFESMQIKDVNQNGLLEILVTFRDGSDAHMTPFLYQYDGEQAEELLGPKRRGYQGPYIYGLLDFKDIDADGVDEALIWNAILGEGECNSCKHTYEIDIMRWIGRRYLVQERVKTQYKISPAAVIRRRDWFNLTNTPTDLDSNLKLESSLAEAERRLSAGLIDFHFVDLLLSRSLDFFDQRHFVEAGQVAQLAYEAALALPDSPAKELRVAFALSLVADNLFWRGNYLAASEPYRRSIAMLEELLVLEEPPAGTEPDEAGGEIDLDWVRGTLISVANDAAIGFMYHDLQTALSLFARSYELSGEIDDLTSQSIAASNQGLVYYFLGDPGRAEEHFTEALALDEALGNTFGQMLNYRHIASLYAVEGDLEQSTLSLQKALDLAIESGDVSQATTYYLDLGRNDYLLGNYDRALESYDLSMLLASGEDIRALQGLLYIYMGDLFTAQGNLESASHFYQKVLNSEDAVDTYSPFGVVWRGHQGLARIAKARNQPDEVLAELVQAVDVIEHQRNTITSQHLSMQFQNSQDKHAAYDELITLLDEQEQVGEAFNYAERAKARSLLDQLGNQDLTLGNLSNSRWIEQEQQLRQRIGELDNALQSEREKPASEQNPEIVNQLLQELEETQQAYEDVLTQSSLENPEYTSFVRVPALTLDEVQTSVLDDETTLVEYYVMEDHLLAWVIDQDEATLVNLEIGREELEDQVELLRNIINEQDFDIEIAAALYDALFAPLQPYIRHNNLVLIPHGVLHYLPFNALWDREQQQYLIEAYAITYAPSASVLKYIQEKRNPDEGRLLVMGNPDRSLPQAEVEVNAVAQLYTTQALTGEEATESQLYAQAGEFDILHLAAHSVYNPYNALYTRIELAADAQNDGYLEVHELFGLDLTGVNLVVLSACETALGEQSNGDELVGLTRAFLYAGAPSVITTLWPVEDEASGALMVSFYENLRAGMTVAEALRQAQIERLSQEETSSPYYWAAFSLTGDYRGEAER